MVITITFRFHITRGHPRTKLGTRHVCRALRLCVSQWALRRSIDTVSLT